MVISRILIGLVFLANIQCAGAFVLAPAAYMHGFGLDSAAGEQMVRALGLLFVMWNVPYVFALADPLKHHVSLVEAVIMQAIGLIGEAAILLLGGTYPPPITNTITRFIVFDGLGLLLLIAALVHLRRVRKPTGSN